MIPVSLTANYFELFGLPVTFVIDKSALTERYRQLQHVVHPDKFANATQQQKRLSVQQSAFINEALQTLKDPLLRAKYILKLKGVDMSVEISTHMDQEFLMEQMELREELANIKSSKQPVDALLTLSEKIDNSITEINTQLSILFNSECDLDEARDTILRYQYYTRILEELGLLEEELA